MNYQYTYDALYRLASASGTYTGASEIIKDTALACDMRHWQGLYYYNRGL